MCLNMPKALGFEDQSKQYCPHKYSSKEHLDYVGHYPLPSYYSVERMSAREVNKFDFWY